MTGVTSRVDGISISLCKFRFSILRRGHRVTVLFVAALNERPGHGLLAAWPPAAPESARWRFQCVRLERGTSPQTDCGAIQSGLEISAHRFASPPECCARPRAHRPRHELP